MNDRLTALDQFRGYTVFGMFLVNFVGGYKNVPTTLGHHHTYCSYADTIMPQFLFAVGMAMRLTFLKRRSSDGPAAPYGKAIKRGLGLFLLGDVEVGATGRRSRVAGRELPRAQHRQGRPMA
jgi:predicted acyltransferase